MVLSVSEGLTLTHGGSFLAWRAPAGTGPFQHEKYAPFLIIQSERSEPLREEDWRPSHSYHYPPNRWAWVRSSPHASSSTVTKESFLEMEWQRSDFSPVGGGLVSREWLKDKWIMIWEKWFVGTFPNQIYLSIIYAAQRPIGWVSMS